MKQFSTLQSHYSIFLIYSQINNAYRKKTRKAAARTRRGAGDKKSYIAGFHDSDSMI